MLHLHEGGLISGWVIVTDRVCLADQVSKKHSWEIGEVGSKQNLEGLEGQIKDWIPSVHSPVLRLSLLLCGNMASIGNQESLS